MQVRTIQLLRKVPEITLIFWITKILTTAMGEATSDFFVAKISPYIAVLLGGLVFLLALFLQLKVRKYIPWIYWLAVAMVAVFGTMAADVMHKGLGVPYIASTTFFAVVLVAVFYIWHRSEKTLSIHSITTTKRELFYWVTVLATFALGTALGDLTAIGFGLGYLASGILFAVLIVIPALAYWLFDLNEIAIFWIVYVLTRPLGASFADWMGKAKVSGGLGWGDGTVSLLLTGCIIISVLFMTFDKKELRRERSRQRIN